MDQVQGDPIMAANISGLGDDDAAFVARQDPIFPGILFGSYHKIHLDELIRIEPNNLTTPHNQTVEKSRKPGQVVIEDQRFSKPQRKPCQIPDWLLPHLQISYFVSLTLFP